MYGAIIGDIVGSRFEFDNHRSKAFDLMVEECFATDDSYMTIAVGRALMEVLAADRNVWDKQALAEASIRHMQDIGRRYPDGGYGTRFSRWIYESQPQPYNSYGNGAAMRVSACAWLGESEEKVKALAECVTAVTHNHPEGLKAAEATTVAIFMARAGATKEEIRARMSRDYYPFDFCLDEIRATYEFSEAAQETMPQALAAFYESCDFEDALRNAVSIGGDSDTLAAITGSIAEAYYGIPQEFIQKARTYLSEEFKQTLDEFWCHVNERNRNSKTCPN